MARRWLDLGPIKMILLVERGYKGWLKANIFVDNSFPLSGQLPPHPHLLHDPLLDDEMSVVISTIFQRMWVLVIKLADDIIEKSCERKGLFQVSSLPKKIQYLRPENIYGQEQKTNLGKWIIASFLEAFYTNIDNCIRWVRWESLKWSW